jgi:hemerythrin superfamily protein
LAIDCLANSSGMDIFTLLTRQHRQAKALLDELAAGEDLSRRERTELLVELQTLLMAHNHAEETVAYNALCQDDATRALAHTAQQEHEHVETLVTRLCGERDEDRWREILEDLRKATEGHTEHEETVIFECLRRSCDPQTLARMLGYIQVDRVEPAAEPVQS